MKIIYIVRSLHLVGGIERTLSDKANWMAAQGHEVMFVTYIQGKDSICFPLDDRIQLYDPDRIFHRREALNIHLCRASEECGK